VRPRTAPGEDRDAFRVSTCVTKLCLSEHQIFNFSNVSTVQCAIILVKSSVGISFDIGGTRADMGIFNGWYSMPLYTVNPVITTSVYGTPLL
jgi:hypothetical protein